jgi:hypothetical protein
MLRRWERVAEKANHYEQVGQEDTGLKVAFAYNELRHALRCLEEVTPWK